MGISVKATALHQTKTQFVQATETAAALTVAAGELKIWVGSSVTNQIEAITALFRCMDALRETNLPDLAAGDERVAQLDSSANAKSQVTISVGAALPAFAETEVAILIGDAWDGGSPANSGRHDKIFRALLERYQEDNLKAA